LTLTVSLKRGQHYRAAGDVTFLQPSLKPFCGSIIRKLSCGFVRGWKQNKALPTARKPASTDDQRKIDFWFLSVNRLHLLWLKTKK